MSNKIYTTIPAPKIPRNTFNRTRAHTFSMVFHRAVPTLCEEILPGDRFMIHSELFSRLQPMVAPVFNQMKISQHSFFVPLRTINKHFSEFMFNNRMGDYNQVLPYLTFGDLYSFMNNSGWNADIRINVGRLFDYMHAGGKCESQTTATAWLTKWNTNNAWMQNSTVRFNLAPFIAYTKVWSEYFRDQNTQDDPFDALLSSQSIDVMDLTGSLASLSSSKKNQILAAMCQLRPRAWAHDRFTSALPWAQRGPEVLLPVQGNLC